MNTYEVEISTFPWAVTVEADTEEEALAKVAKSISSTWKDEE